MEFTNDPMVIRSVLRQIEHLQDIHKKEYAELLDRTNMGKADLLAKIAKERKQLEAKNTELLLVTKRDHDKAYQDLLDKKRKEQENLKNHLDALKKENEGLKDELQKFNKVLGKFDITNLFKFIHMLVIISVFWYLSLQDNKIIALMYI